MKKFDVIGLIAFTSALLILVMWVRSNLVYFAPILEASTLFFQLILAVTVIAFLRSVIGLRTFGVFGPTIIALGIIVPGLIWGLTLYIDVFIMAMLTSFIIYPLAIASSHRIAIVITSTAISITILELVAEIYHMDILETSILFPVLITSWLADRFVVQVKETDWIEPSKKLLGTVVTIIISYYIITYKPVILFIALNPETWVILIVVNIFIALKINFRFSEHFRFKPAIAAEGSSKNVLGLNKRNREYIAKYNPANLYPHTAKDKMKITFHQLGIPTPQTYAIIHDIKEIVVVEKVIREHDSFVIKPASGLGGEGILVLDKVSEKGEEYFRGRNRNFSIEDIKHHLVQILDGQYSSEWSDVAIIEEKINPDMAIVNYYWRGVPDIRVIVFEGFPVMAMTRLPTKESGGTANIHKGAISMGLTIAEGKGVNPYWKGHGGSRKRHPDTKAVLTDMHLENWPRILEIAAFAQAASRLGYAGVDIVLDEKGPVVLEVNKRPGLEIQNTNLAGLLKRIEFVENKFPEVRFIPVSEKIQMCIEWDKQGWRD